MYVHTRMNTTRTNKRYGFILLLFNFILINNNNNNFLLLLIWLQFEILLLVLLLFYIIIVAIIIAIIVVVVVFLCVCWCWTSHYKKKRSVERREKISLSLSFGVLWWAYVNTNDKFFFDNLFIEIENLTPKLHTNQLKAEKEQHTLECFVFFFFDFVVIDVAQNGIFFYSSFFVLFDKWVKSKTRTIRNNNKKGKENKGKKETRNSKTFFYLHFFWKKSFSFFELSTWINKPSYYY